MVQRQLDRVFAAAAQGGQQFLHLPYSTAAAAAAAAPPVRFRSSASEASPFSALVCLGSPLGCFLSLRGQRLGRGFELPLCRSMLYNIFSRTAPVAYRIEPLLVQRADGAGGGGGGGGGSGGDDDDEGTETENDDDGSGGGGGDDGMPFPPPEYVPFAGAKSGKRLHIKLRQAISSTADTLHRSVSDMQDAVHQTTKSVIGVVNGLQGWLGVARDNLAGGKAADESSAGRARARKGAFGRDEGDDGAPWALNGGGRVDYQLQETEFEAAGEYLAALKAHTSYFSSVDIVSFILHDVCR